MIKIVVINSRVGLPVFAGPSEGVFVAAVVPRTLDPSTSEPLLRKSAVRGVVPIGSGGTGRGAWREHE